MSDNKPLIFGMPVYVNNAVPHDAVFVRVDGDIKRLIDLANGEKEVVRLRARVAELEAALMGIADGAHANYCDCYGVARAALGGGE